MSTFQKQANTYKPYWPGDLIWDSEEDLPLDPIQFPTEEQKQELLKKYPNQTWEFDDDTP